jgi:hypothetical protein
MSDEIKVNEDGLMKRPTVYDKCVLRRAAEIVFPAIKGWLGEGFATDEEIMDDLIDCIGKGDGFLIAEDLKSHHHWDNCDSSLVAILDGNFVDTAQNELERQWVKCLGVTLDIPIGAMVNIKSRKESGAVVKHYPLTAKYGVRTPDQEKTSNWILLPEDVEVAA